MNLSWLITLVCPLMMIFMMFGMGGKHGHGHGSRKQEAPGYHELQKELNDLKVQNEQMKRDIQSLTP